MNASSDTTQSEPHKRALEAHCPNCDCNTHFIYGGEQEFPARVQAVTGLPSAISLWHCERCHSTFCEYDLTQ